MNCTQARNLFEAYLDDELSGALATEFGAHQLKCAACRRELALLEVAGRVIAADSGIPSLSAGFTDLVVEHAVRGQVPWYRRKNWMVGAGASLAVAASLFLAVTPSVEPRVLGQTHTPTVEEMRQSVMDAARRDPDNVELQKFADTLNVKSQEFFENTKDRAIWLERQATETMMRVLESIPTESSREGDQDANDPAPKNL